MENAAGVREGASHDGEPGTQTPTDDWAGRSRLTYQGLRVIVTVAARLRLVRVTVEGVENLPEDGPAVLMSNHQSNLDPLFIGWCSRRPISIPGKRELFGVPVLRLILKGLGSFPVDRDRADAAALRRLVDLLRANRLICIFPEGTRSRSGEVGPFQSTLVRVALKRNVPLIPVAVDGTGAVLGPGKLLPRFGAHVAVRFGTPVQTTDQSGGAADPELVTSSLRDRVLALLRTQSRE